MAERGRAGAAVRGESLLHSAALSTALSTVAPPTHLHKLLVDLAQQLQACRARRVGPGRGAGRAGGHVSAAAARVQHAAAGQPGGHAGSEGTPRPAGTQGQVQGAHLAPAPTAGRSSPRWSTQTRSTCPAHTGMSRKQESRRGAHITSRACPASEGGGAGAGAPVHARAAAPLQGARSHPASQPAQLALGATLCE